MGKFDHLILPKHEFTEYVKHGDRQGAKCNRKGCRVIWWSDQPERPKSTCKGK